ncbi:MAG: class I SAM-dependent methyltransferase [Bacteroidetes bacterium]|nr:class I SAM-dependent methyltransferase [Bacteroidota bacterium]
MKLSDHTAHYKQDAEQFDYFAERSGADLDASTRLQQTVMHFVSGDSPQRVLDLGSGGGWLLEMLASSPAHSKRVVCADLGIASLRTLRKRNPDALLVAADAERLPFRSGSFDVVVASEVLEHLNRPDYVVRQAAAILAPAGRLITSTPYRERLRYYLCIHCNQPTPVNAHLHSFDEHALMSMFGEAGLRHIRHATFQNKAMVFLRISWALRFLPWSIWRLIDRLFNFVIRKPHSIVITGEKTETHDH